MQNAYYRYMPTSLNTLTSHTRLHAYYPHQHPRTPSPTVRPQTPSPPVGLGEPPITQPIHHHRPISRSNEVHGAMLQVSAHQCQIRGHTSAVFTPTSGQLHAYLCYRLVVGGGA